MTSQSTPFGRFRAFVSDYAARWQEYVELRDPSAWASAQRELAESHFVDGFHDESPLPTENAHPLQEKVLETKIADDRALMKTYSGRSYYQYAFVRSNGDWRIASLVASKEDPGPLEASPPLVEPTESARILASATLDAVLEPMPEGQYINGDEIFRRGAKLDATHFIDVAKVCVLRTRSGVIAVRDFSYGADGIEPLARKLPPGDYPVEVAFSDHRPSAGEARHPSRNLALRLRIGSERPTVAWHPIGSIGVDMGAVTIFDVGNFLSLTRFAWERLVQNLFSDDDAPAHTIRMIDPDDCVVVETGDGAFPCYWGVDGAGALTVLQIDFILAPGANVAEAPPISEPRAAPQRPEPLPSPVADRVETRWAPIPPRALVRRMTSAAKEMLESAVRRAVEATHYEVTVEHMLREMLERDDGDVAAIYEYFHRDRKPLEQRIQEVIGRQRRGNTGRPMFANLLFPWIQEAWLHGSIEYGAEGIRTGHLFYALLVHPGRYLDGRNEELAEFPIDELQRGIEDAVAATREQTESTSTLHAPEPVEELLAEAALRRGAKLEPLLAALRTIDLPPVARQHRSVWNELFLASLELFPTLHAEAVPLAASKASDTIDAVLRRRSTPSGWI